MPNVKMPNGMVFKNVPRDTPKEVLLEKMQKYEAVKSIPSDYLSVAKENIGNPEFETKFKEKFGVDAQYAIEKRLKKQNVAQPVENVEQQPEEAPFSFYGDGSNTLPQAIKRGNKQAALGAIQTLGIYPELKGEFQQQAKELEQEGKGTGVTGFIGETLGNPVNYVTALIPSLKVGGKIASSVVNAASRAVQGGISGELQPETKDGEKTSNAINTAAAFAILPPVMGKIFGGATEAVKYSSQKISDFFKTAPEKAQKLIIETAKIEGVAPKVIADRLSEAQKLNPNATVLDAVQKRVGDVAEQGDYFRGLAKGASEKISPADVVGTNLSKIPVRQASQRIRVENALDDAFGTKNVFRVSEEIAKNKANIATKLREKAVSFPKNIDATDLIDVLNKTPAGKQVVDSVNTTVQQGIELGIKKPTTTEYLDAMKKALDRRAKDLNNPNADATLKDAAANFSKISDLLKDRIKSQNPYYSQYLKEYGDEFKNENALELGSGFLKESVETLKSKFSKFSKPEKEAFLTGVKESLLSKIDNKGDLQDFISPILREDVKSRLQPLFTSKLKAEQFFKNLDTEKSMLITTKDFVSRDKSKLSDAYSEDVKDALKGMSNSINFNTSNVIQNSTLRVIAKKIERKFSNLDKDTAKIITDILYSKDPKKMLYIQEIADKKGIKFGKLIKEAEKIKKFSPTKSYLQKAVINEAQEEFL